MRSLTDAARSTLTGLTAYWLTLWALAGAIDLYLDSSVDMAGIRQPLLLAWFAAAVALLASRFAPPAARGPVLLGITVSLAIGTVLTREVSGLVAPWLQITVAAGMVLTAVGFLASYRLLPLVGLLVVALVLAPQRADEMLRENSPVELGVPLMEAVLILALGLLAALIRAVLLQSAQRSDQALAEARRASMAALAETTRSDAVTEQMALLHDTALNTLDAIALRPNAQPEVQRRRCLDDADRLNALAVGATQSTSLRDAVARLGDRAHDLGITLVVDADVESAQGLPAEVVDAVVGALDEAVLNVAKHAGAGSAVLRVSADEHSLRASLQDAGVGFDPETPSTGFGIEGSLGHRMAMVGGQASVDSEPGSGTTVRVEWRRPGESAESVERAVSQVVVRLATALIATTTAFSVAAVTAEWRAFERPAIALVGGLLLGAWGLLVTRLLTDRRWIPTSIGVVTVALACVAPFWTIASDQYCASSFGGLGWVDPRVPLVVAVMITAGKWWRGTAAVPAFVGATVLAGTVWGGVFSGCQGWAITASTYAVVIFMAALIAGRALNRNAARIGEAQRALDEAERGRVRAAAGRTERQQWFGPAVASCVPLLSAIGDGSADPSTEDVRQRCRTESGYLRGLVTAAQAPTGVRDGLREALQRAHAAGLDVVVRGDLGALPPPPQDVGPVLLRLIPTDLTGSAAIAVTGMGGPGTGSLTVHVPGVSSPDAPVDAEPLPEGVDVALDDVDGLLLEVSWQAGSARLPAVTT